MRHIRFASIGWRAFAAGLLAFCLVSGNVSTIVAAGDPVVMPIHASAAKAAFQSGVTVTEYPIPTPNSGSSNITPGPDENFYFTETNGNKIGQVTPDGEFTEFPLATANSQPFGIILGPEGDLWFTEQGTNRIGRMALDGTVNEFSIATANSKPFGIANGSDAALWFTENTANQIGRITASGVITEFPIPTPNSGPLFITPGPDDNLWFTERNASRIARITPAGMITEFVTPTPNSGPEGVTSGLDGNIWFTERNVDKVGFVTTSGSITEIQLFAGSDPARITGATDGSVYVTEHAPGKLLRITQSAAAQSFAPSDLTFEEVITSRDSGLQGVQFIEEPDLHIEKCGGAEEQGNKILVGGLPLLNSQIDFTKTASPSGSVMASTQVTYTFTVKNHSAQLLEFRIYDVTSPGPSNPSNANIPDQAGWLKFVRHGNSLEGVTDGFLTLSPGKEIQLQLLCDTLMPGTLENLGSLVVRDAFIIKRHVSTTITPSTTPDFALAFDQPTITVPAGTGKVPVTVKIIRTGGFTGSVTVTPPPKANGIKPKPADPIETTGDSVVFKFKAGGASPGQYPLTFTATDGSGKTRTGTVTLIVQ